MLDAAEVQRIDVDEQDERIQAGLDECAAIIMAGHARSVEGIFQVAEGIAKASDLLGGSFRLEEWVLSTCGYGKSAASKYRTIWKNEWLTDKKVCDWSKLPPSPWTIYELAADKRILGKPEFKKVIKGVRPDMTREELRTHLDEILLTKAEKEERAQTKEFRANAKQEAFQLANQREREHACSDPLYAVHLGSSAASMSDEGRVVEGAAVSITGEDETPLNDFELKDDNAVVFESDMPEAAKILITASLLRTLRRLNIAHHEVLFRAKTIQAA